MRKFVIVSLSIVLLGVTAFTLMGFTQPQHENTKEETAILILLSPYMEQAINNFYGDKIALDYMGRPATRQTAFYNARVDYIKRITNTQSQFTYEVKVTIPTFHGAHNDPQACEVMTFIIEPLTEPKLVAYQNVPLTVFSSPLTLS